MIYLLIVKTAWRNFAERINLSGKIEITFENNQQNFLARKRSANGNSIIFY